MTYKEIAEKFDVSLSALKRHRLNHMPLYLKVGARVRTVEDDHGVLTRVISAVVDGKRMLIRLDPYLREVGKRWRICETPEEIKAGKAHAAKVRKHCEEMGEPERWDELVADTEANYPGLRVVQ